MRLLLGLVGLIFFCGALACDDSEGGEYEGPPVDDWSVLPADQVPESVQGVIWSDSPAQFVMAQDATIGLSPDGTQWSTVTGEEGEILAGGGISMVTQCTPSEYLAVSSVGEVLNSEDDGASWTRTDTVDSGEVTWNGASIPAAFSAIACTAAHAVGLTRSGTVYRGVSDLTFDGVQWHTDWFFEKSDFAFEGGIHALVWDGSRYVAVGEGGLVATSPNGGVWTLRETGLTEDLNDVAVFGEGLVVVGDVQTVAFTEDGVTWVTVPVQGVAQSLVQVVVMEEFIIAFGEEGAVVVIEDGEVVHMASLPVTGIVSSVASNGELFVVTTREDGVLVSSAIAE